ncbi:MAG: double zinc ribbon domain-containing protein [Ruminococcus sp.]|jgi:ComF family protein
MKVREWLLACVFPGRCPACDGILDPGLEGICPSCREKLKIVEGVHCSRCGKFIENDEKEFCENCKNSPHFFEEGYGVFPYAGWVQESVVRFKFHGRAEYGKFYGKMMGVCSADRVGRWRPQVILPVPMYRGKKKRRGYNQAEILAREAGKYLDIPVRTDLLFRVRNTKPQKEMTPQKRRENLKGAFRALPECGNYERILLVDDIYTTGSTMDAIAEILKQQGTGKIYFLTACTGSGF